MSGAVDPETVMKILRDEFRFVSIEPNPCTVLGHKIIPLDDFLFFTSLTMLFSTLLGASSLITLSTDHHFSFLRLEHHWSAFQ